MSVQAVAWNTFHADAARTGINGPGPANVKKVLWTSPPELLTRLSNPVLGANKAYVPSVTQIIAFNLSDGSVAWRSEVSAAKWGSFSSAAYDLESNSVYIGSGTVAYRIDADTGDIVWETPLGVDLVNGSPLVANGYVVLWDNGFFDPTQSKLYTLRVSDGGIERQVNATGSGACSPAFDEATGRFYVTISKQMRAYDIASGSEAWTSPWTAADEFYGGISLANGYLYAQTYPFGGKGRLLKVDAANGAIVWDATCVENGDAAPVVQDGVVIVQGGFSDGVTVAHRDTDGSVAWIVEQGDYAGTSAGSNNGFVYSAGNRGTGLNVIDASNGTVLDTRPGIAGSPSIHDGIVYAITQAGELIALAAAPVAPAAAPDLNQDGFVDWMDLLLFSQDWHTGVNETDFGTGN